MKIMVAGGSGFVGRALIPELIKAGHDVIVVGRNKDKIQSIFATSVTAITWQEISSCHPDDFMAVINLTGANIAGRRWSEEYKRELISSRVNATKILVDWCHSAHQHKPHLYNASAIGYYGLQDSMPDHNYMHVENEIVDDKTDPSFSGHLVREWERAATQYDDVSVTIMRFGVVLRRGEGMLKQLEMPARFGLGAVVGSGLQPITWIDADDLVSAILFLLARPDVTGVVNMTAPNVVSQKEFTQSMCSVMHRPCWLWLPAQVVKMLFGQMGEELLLSGQAARPQRLQQLGFRFKYTELNSALQHEFVGK